MISLQEQEFRRKLRELRDHLVKNAENVGPRFPEEARKIHYGEAEHRSIYGIASPKDAKALHEEAIYLGGLLAQRVELADGALGRRRNAQRLLRTAGCDVSPHLSLGLGD